MVIEESTAADAAERAKAIVSGAVQKAEELVGLGEQSIDCVTKALESAKEIRSDVASARERLKPVSSTIVSQVQSRIKSIAGNIADQAEEAAENTADTLGGSTQRLALEALSAGLGTSTGKLGQLAKQKMGNAITENIEDTFGEGTLREVRRKGKKARKACVSALSIVADNKDVFFRGVMGILIQRTARDLRRMEEELVNFRSNMRQVKRGASLAGSIRDALEGENLTPKIDQAALVTEGARQQMTQVRVQYHDNQVVNKPLVESAGEGFSRASRLLSSSRAAELFRSAISNRGRGQRDTLKSARDALGRLGTGQIASLHGQALTWAGLARAFPDTVRIAIGTAELVKAGQEIRYIEVEAERIKKAIDSLDPEEVERRAELSLDLEKLSTRLGLLSAFSEDNDISEREWYKRAASFFRRPFFRNRSEEGRLQRLELFEGLAQQAAGLVELRPRAGEPIEATTTTLGRVREVREEAEELAQEYEDSNPVVSTVVDLLSVAGVGEPIESILRGTFSQEMQGIFAGASAILPSLQDGGCPDVSGVLPSDKEQALVQARQQMREQERTATGAITAIAESDAVDAQRVAGLPQ